MICWHFNTTLTFLHIIFVFETSTVAVDPRHLKVEVAEQDFPNCFAYLLAPFIWQIFKKMLRANPELWGCAILAPKIVQFVRNNFFWYKLLLLLSSSYWFFPLGKIFKKFLQRIQSYEDTSFLGPKWSICPKQKNFFKKIIKIIFIYLLAPFVVQNLKKIFTVDPELWRCVTFGPKIAHLSKWKFFQKTC